MNSYIYGIVLLVCLVVPACASKSSSPTAPPDPSTPVPPAPVVAALESVELFPTGRRGWFSAGSTDQSNAGGTFSDGTRKIVTPSCTNWQSDNTFVLTIDNGGRVTHRNSGSATITTTCDGVSARALVTLNVIPTTLWTRSGTGTLSQGDALPSYVRRVQVTARSRARTAVSFLVLTTGQPLVSRLLQPNVPYVGTHVVFIPSQPPPPLDGPLDVRDASNTTAWTLAEVR